MEHPHTKLLAEIAKCHLAPLGVIRKGRSRTWLDDQRWFVTVVEFQPSGFSKGSYLNVGAHFLWCAKGHISFDLGYRLEDFVPFESCEQFSPQVERLSARAAAEVGRLRALLTDVRTVAVALPEETNGADWASYHRAIALGLCGNTERASDLFSMLIEPPHSYPWVAERASQCQVLLDLLQSPSEFRKAVTQLVHEQRRALRLGAIDDPFHLQNLPGASAEHRLRPGQ
jgi:hypothetical protein